MALEDRSELEDLVLSRYQDVGYVFQLGIPQVTRLITKAYESKTEQRLHDRYCALLPYMKKQIDFDKWKQDVVVRPRFYDGRSKAEIMKELKGEQYGTI